MRDGNISMAKVDHSKVGTPDRTMTDRVNDDADSGDCNNNDETMICTEEDEDRGITKLENDTVDFLIEEEEVQKKTNEEKSIGSGIPGRTLVQTLDNIEEELNSVSEDRSYSGVEKSMAEAKLIKRTPYFPECVEEVFRQAKEQFVNANAEFLMAHQEFLNADAAFLNANAKFINTHAELEVENMEGLLESNQDLDQILSLLDDDNRRIVNVVPDDQKLSVALQLLKQDAEMMKKDAEMKKKDAEMKKKDAESAKDKAVKNAQRVMKKMSANVKETRGVLNRLAGMSQAEATCSKIGAETAAAADAMAKQTSGDLAGEVPAEVQSLLKNPEKLDYKEYIQSDLTNNPDAMKSYEQLKTVVQDFEGWVSKSTVLSSGSKNFDENIRTSIESFMRPSNYKSDTTCFPHISAGEVKGSQPVFRGLLQRIADCWRDCTTAKSFSPFKTELKPNQIIPGTAARPRRIVDLCIRKPGRVEFLMYDSSMKLLCELKPLIRRQVSPEKLEKEGFEQVIANLAKFIAQCLDFQGYGVSSFATGLTGSLAYVEIVKLDLTLQTATADGRNIAVLKLYQSKKLPIMSRECFDTWVEKSETKQNQSLSALRQSLYADNNGLDENGIPIGIRLLWELLALRREKLFGPDYKKVFFNDQIGDLLGSGSFSVVFAMKDREECVLKVPAVSSVHHVETEISMLTALSRLKNEVDDVALPVLQEVQSLNFILGGVSCKTRGMILSPRGIPIAAFLHEAFKRFDANQFVNSIVEPLESALEYIHSKNIYHYDVTPKNLVVVENISPRVCLVDFGGACKVDQQLIGFRGTPLFAHQYIFCQYPGNEWEPNNRHDFFSLALSICALLSECKATWDMNGFPCSLTPKKKPLFLEKLAKRQEEAKKVIREKIYSVEKSELLTQWLDYETLNSPRGRKRKTRKT